MYCFAKICRLCMSHDGTLIHCKARDKNNIPNYHKIKVLFPQLINKTARHFPIWICSKCQEQVNELYEFKQKCYKTYHLLKKYTTQLYEANREKKIPNVPGDIFQEIKPVVYNRLKILEEEKNSDTYYNADDITIVKNELLPNNLKNEPEYHNMIQAIIDNNIEAVRKIDADLKCETSTGNIETVPEPEPESEPELELVIEKEPEVDIEEALQIEIKEAPEIEIEITETPEIVIKEPELELELEEEAPENTPENSTNETTEQTETTNQLNAFTLDYTNASFETFVSHVGPKITTTEETQVMEIAQQITSCKRVLRQRKSICYRTMEKGLSDVDEPPPVRRTRSSSTVPKTPTKKTQPSPPKTKIMNKRTTEISDTIITRNKDGVYFCDRCMKQYKRLPAFKLHVVKCKGFVRHRCTECGKDFANVGNLKRHSAISHVMLKFKMKCTYCPNEYVRTGYMRKHMQMRHNQLFMDKRHSSLFQ